MMRQSVTLLPDLARPAPPGAPLGKAWHTSSPTLFLSQRLPSIQPWGGSCQRCVACVALQLACDWMQLVMYPSLTDVVRHRAEE